MSYQICILHWILRLHIALDSWGVYWLDSLILNLLSLKLFLFVYAWEILRLYIGGNSQILLFSFRYQWQMAGHLI